MKVIFLDIDGVLNTSETFDLIEEEYQKTGMRRIEIDEFRLEYLKQIIEQTGANIILSSSWIKYLKKEDKKISIIHKKGMQLATLLSKHKIYVYDILDNITNKQESITNWLNNHKNIESFIIIDDDSYDLTDFINNGLIKTSNITDGEMIIDMKQCTGLCEQHTKNAIKILNRIK